MTNSTIDISGCRTIKDVAILLCGKYHGRSRLRAIAYIESLGMTPKEWLQSKKPKKNTTCLLCGKTLSGDQKLFCSNSCSATYNNKIRVRKNKKNNVAPHHCAYCGKELKNRASKYCNLKCMSEHYQQLYIDRWKRGEESGIVGDFGTSHRIRRYMFMKNNNKCECCGWGEMNQFTGTIPLELHHIDGNYRNNKEENLQLLCPNCHSLVETMKSHNKNGREKRRKIK